MTQKTAWFMFHRIRQTTGTDTLGRLFTGEVEVDETFVGGKAQNRRGNSGARRGAGTARANKSGKAVVFGLLELAALQITRSRIVTVSQVRIARPTDRLDGVVRFYRDALGLAVIGSFHDHAGYDGVMLALPGRRDHLEFTAHRDGSPCPAPSRDNLLVFYLPERAEFEALQARMLALGITPAEPENPYWHEQNAVTFEDPDGWRVVLFPGAGL